LTFADGEIPYTKLDLTHSIQATDLAEGAVTFDANDLGTESVTPDKLASNIPLEKITIGSNSIDGNAIIDSTIGSEKLSGNIGMDKLTFADGEIPYTKLDLTHSIQATDLAEGAVSFSADDLAAESVTADKLASNIPLEKITISPNSIDGLTIIDGSIPYTKVYLYNQISSMDIADNSITDTDISESAEISYSKLDLSQSVNSADIVDGSVTISKLQLLDSDIPYTALNLYQSITSDDLAPGVLSSNTITTENIADASITYSKLALDANEIPYTKINLYNQISSMDIADNSITDTDISESAEISYSKLDLYQSVNAADIVDGSVTISKLQLLDSDIPYTALNLANSITEQDMVDGSITYSKLSLSTEEIPYAKLNLYQAIQEDDLAPGVLSVTIASADIVDGSVTYTKLTLADFEIPYTKVDLNGRINSLNIADGTITDSDISNAASITYAKLLLTDSVTNTDISEFADITYTKLNLTDSIISSDIVDNSIMNTDISSSAEITYSKLDLTTSIVNSDISEAAEITYLKLDLTNSIVEQDIVDGSVTYTKLSLSNEEIPYAKLKLYHAIQEDDLAPGVLSNTISTGDIADSSVTYTKLLLEDYEIPYTKLNLTNAITSDHIKDKQLFLNTLTVSGNTDITGTTTIEGMAIINNNLNVSGTLSANALEITDTATINGTIEANAANITLLTANTASLLTSISFKGATQSGYSTNLVVEEPSSTNTITFPNASGTIMLSGSGGGDMTYSSVTAAKANFDNLTINNALLLINSANPAGRISMTTSAISPYQITIPDMSGTMVVTQENGTNGQAIVSDGSGGYTWKTLTSGLTHEISVGEGGDYSTITQALDSITDNSSLNLYVIKVGPGTYVEQVSMKEYVDIRGSGKSATIIQAGGSSTIEAGATIIGANNASICNLTVKSDSSAEKAVGIYNNNASPIIDNIIIESNSSHTSAYVYGIYNNSSNSTISNVQITSNSTGGSANVYGIYNNSSNAIISYVQIESDTSGMLSYGVFNESSSPLVKHSFIETTGGDYSTAFYSNASSTPKVQHVNIVVNSASDMNIGAFCSGQANVIFNHTDILISGSTGSTNNSAFKIENSNPIINNTIGRVLVSTKPNFGIYNSNTAKPELNNVTLEVKNGSTNTKIYNDDVNSTIVLNATNYIGSITANAAELTQITIKSNAYLITQMTFKGAYSADAYNTKIKVEEPTKANTITFPDASGTVMLSGSGGGDMTYTSVTAAKASFDNLTINNSLILFNAANPAGTISMTTSAILPRQITIPDISGTMVVTQENGTNGQAIVSDGSGGYTWQTLSSGLTHEIKVGEGVDYSTITQALDSITDNSVSNQYVIKVGPGTYSEQVVMKEYVDIKGSGTNATIIKAEGDSTSKSIGATVIGADHASICNLSIQSDSSVDYAVGLYNNNVSPKIENLVIDSKSSSMTAYVYGIYNDTANPIISNVEVKSESSGMAAYVFGICNFGGNPLIKQTWIKASSGQYAIGIHNISASTPEIQHTNIITTEASSYNYGVKNEQATPTLNHVDIKIFGTSGSTNNCAFYNSESNPVINNTIGRVLVSSNPNYGIYNHISSKPVLNNVTLDVKNGSTNTKIYNYDATSTISLSATNLIGSITANAAELTQITIKSNAFLITQMTFKGAYSADAYNTKIKVEEPTKANIITFPDASGTVMLSGSGGGDMTYTSVTAAKASFDNLTINNSLILFNAANPAGTISMTTSAILPRQITIPDISGTMVVTQENGTNGQAIVSDGSGGYTWQTLSSGLTHEIKVGEGGDYSSITQALDSITDNSVSNQYVIKVGPGTYEEQVMMKEYVDIKGSGKNATVITTVGGSSNYTTSASVIGADNSSIYNLSIQSNSTDYYAVGIYNNNASPKIENIAILSTSSEDYASVYGICNETASPIISYVEITSETSGSNASAIGIYNSGGSPLIKQSWIKVTGGRYTMGIQNKLSSTPDIQYVNINANNASESNYGVHNEQANPILNYMNIRIDGSSGNQYNCAFYNEYSNPVINNSIGRVLVSSNTNYGIYNYMNSKPVLNNVTLESTNAKIYNYDATSTIALSAANLVGSITANAVELTQITIKSNAYLVTQMTFQGSSSADAYETNIKVEEPTKANTITFPDASGTVMLSGGSGGSLAVSSVTANSGTYTELSVSNQITLSQTIVGGDVMLADEYIAITTNTNPADSAFFFGEKSTEGAWRMVRIGTSLVFQRFETGTWVNKMSVNP
jgi:hypothetical protein